MVDVDPAQLDGYAAQLLRNADFFDTPLKLYCSANCNKTDDMTGVLWPAQKAVHLTHDATVGILTSGRQELGQVSFLLKQAADEYRKADSASAEKIWTVYAKGADKRPADWHEKDSAAHKGVFTDPFTPNPPPAKDFNDFKPAVGQAKKDLGKIQEWCQEYFHFNLAGILSDISGDWDTLREDASGYESLAGRAGVQPIADNLEFGMDSLSSSWNNSDAAAAFDYHIRARWIPAIEFLQHFLETQKEMFEYVAQEAKTTFDVLVVAIQEAIKWVPKKVLQILKLIKSVVLAFSAGVAIKQLVAFLLDLKGTIMNVIKILKDLVEGFCEEAEVLAKEIQVAKEMWSGKHAPLVGG